MTRYDLSHEECQFLVNALHLAATTYKECAGNCRENEAHHRLAEQFERQELQAIALMESFERGI